MRVCSHTHTHTHTHTTHTIEKQNPYKSSFQVTNQFGVKEIARGDDIWWNERLQSEVDFAVSAGSTYFIAVGGFRGASGNIKLVGRVESWIYPPVKIDRVATPVFKLDLFGEQQDSTRMQQSKFVTVSISTSTPEAQIFYTTVRSQTYSLQKLCTVHSLRR